MIVLITGASSGFGEEMARTFVRNGHKVIASARRADRLTRLQQELGAALLPVSMDVTDKTSISTALAGLPSDWKAIDVLSRPLKPVTGRWSRSAPWMARAWRGCVRR